MRLATPGIALTIVVAAAGACNVDRLVDPAPDRVLAAAPSKVDLAAQLGSTAPQPGEVAITSLRNDSVGWTARRVGSGDWLDLETNAGATPGSLHLVADPTGLNAGVYRDTIVVSPTDPDLAPLRVPVALTVGECRPAAITVPTEVVDSLRATDCGSSHRPGGVARRFRFEGTTGDTLSFVLISNEFAGFLVIDTSSTESARPLVESGSCPGAIGDACVLDLRLPRTGSYTVEVTTTGSGPATGAFTFEVAPPRAPAPPEGLGQFRTDSVTPISVGGTTPERAFVVQGELRDPDRGDALRLAVEFRRLDESFTGEATAISGPVPVGARASVRLSGLTDTTGYHWRARVVDRSGRASAWVSFGANPENAPDLTVAVAATRLAFRTQPTTTSAGGSIAPPVQVEAVDANGTPVPSFSGSVTVTLSGGTAGAVLSGTRTASAIDGVASFPGLSIDRSGTDYRLVAASDGLVSASSATFGITPGAATHLTFSVQPSGASAGRPITPAVRVSAWDAHGNAATGFTGNVTIALGRDGSVFQNARLSGVLTVAASAGTATFANLSIDQVGVGYDLVATASGLGTVTSTRFDVAPIGGTPTRQAFTVQPSSTAAGDAITPAVEVTILDALGAPVQGFTDEVAIVLDDPGGATLAGTQRVAAVAGRARFSDLRVDRPATAYRLRATTVGLPDLVSAPFTVTPVVPTTGGIAITTSTTGSDIDPDGYTVTVDANGRSIGVNASATFTDLPAGDHALTLGGVAPNCTVGGQNPRTVSVTAGNTTSTAFAIACADIPPPPATALRFASQPPGTMIVAGTFGASVEALDGSGGRVTGYTGRVTLVLQGGVLGTSLSGTTAVDAVGGVAQFTDLRITGPCVGCRLIAAASGLAGATSEPFNVVIP